MLLRTGSMVPIGSGALLKKKFGPWPILRAHFGPRPKILRAHFGPWPDWSRGAKNSKFTRSVTCLKEIGIIWSMDYSERRCFVSLRVVHGPRVPYRIWSMIPEFSDRFGPWTNLVHGPNSFSGALQYYVLSTTRSSTLVHPRLCRPACRLLLI